MEVRQHGVDRPEPVPRRDEEAGPARRGGRGGRAGLGVAVQRLEHAHGRRPHGHQPPALGPGGIEPGDRIRRHVVGLLVDDVFLDALLGHGPERVDAHVQRDRHHVYAARAEGGEQLRREMQSRRGRRGRALRLGVHRLVVVGSCQGSLDVGRQRHGALFLEDRPEAGPALQAHVPAALPEARGQVHLATPRGPQHLSGAQPAGRPRKHLPESIAAVARVEEEQLDSTAGGLVHPQPGRDDPGIVDHQHVTRQKMARQVAETVVDDAPLHRVDHHETAGVAGLRGCLRDQVRGDLEIEFV